jgi:peptide deformylase
MSYRKVLTWPNPQLRKKSLEVEDFGDSLSTAVNDMIDTLRVELGAGLAAPQVGIFKRVVILDCSMFGIKNPDPQEGINSSLLVLINPVLELGAEYVEWKEACLSVPGEEGIVKRSKNIEIKYDDMKGAIKNLCLGWPLSGGIQHECDHLDGRLYIDLLSRWDKDRINTRMKKRLKEKKRMKNDLSLERKIEKAGYYSLEEYRKMTHGTGKKKKKNTKNPGKSFGKKKKK